MTTIVSRPLAIFLGWAHAITCAVALLMTHWSASMASAVIAILCRDWLAMHKRLAEVDA